MITDWATVFSPQSFEQEWANYVIRAEAAILDLAILSRLSRQEIIASLKLEYERRGGITVWSELLYWAQEYAAEHDGELPFMVVVDGDRLLPESIVEGSST